MTMAVRVRPLKASGWAAVPGIERRITGSRRTGTLARNLRKRLAQPDRGSCLAAVEGDRVVGFIVGEIRPWEFGEEREVGWILVVGVDPDHQGKGVGGMLGASLLRHFRAKGVRRAKTLAEGGGGGGIAGLPAL